jgi:hypothetical protein
MFVLLYVDFGTGYTVMVTHTAIHTVTVTVFLVILLAVARKLG